MLSREGSKIALFYQSQGQISKVTAFEFMGPMIYHDVWFIILLNSWAKPSKSIQLGKQMYKKTIKRDFKMFYNIK